MLTLNLTDIDKQIEAAQKKILEAVDLLGRQVLFITYSYIARDVGEGADIGSPVWSGQFYTNHMVSVGTPSTARDLIAGRTREKPASPKPPKPIDKGVVASFKATLGQTAYITNNLSYADLIEQGIASKKTPRGVYRVAAEKMANDFRNKI